jgi:hypothetical protein
MDAWWPRLVREMFAPRLGRAAFDALGTVLPVGDDVEGADPNAPAYSQGWWGYVSKDLRRIFPSSKKQRRPSGWHYRWCGSGGPKRCRAALERSLREALAVSKADLYGRGDCAKDADAECFDRNRSTTAGAVGLPAAPFQNRPTFQQVVELTRRLPR